MRVLLPVAGHIKSRLSAGTILDVGCATGFFLSQFFEESRWQKRGVELSRSSAKQAAKNGVQVYLGGVRDAQLPSSSIDVITVLDAFYYFPNPQTELSEFHRLLKDDGFLVLEMPLAGSRIWRLSGLGKRIAGTGQPLLETSDHLYYYTPQSIVNLLRQRGFRVDTVSCLPGNQQESTPRDFFYRSYSCFSRGLEWLTRSRILLGPRFMVVAGRDPANRPVALEDRRALLKEATCEIHS